MDDPISVAVIGTGAIGGYYGARLAQAGRNVHFLMRRDFEAVREHGLTVTSPDGDFKLANPKIVQSSREIGPVDWVICALKSTSMDAAKELVQPCVSANTRILVLMNGIGLEERFAEWFDSQHIFGGMAFICANRGEPASFHHLAYGRVTIGHFRNDPAELESAQLLWRGSKVKTSVTSSLRCTRWEKLSWNIPFGGLCVTSGGVPVDAIIGDTGLRKVARTLMEEVISAGNADLEANSEKSRLDSDAVVKYMFEVTEKFGAYKPSLLLDFLEGKPMEVEALFLEPLRRAQSLNVNTPQLELLSALLQFLDICRIREFS